MTSIIFFCTIVNKNKSNMIDYIPNADSEKVLWFTNFKTKAVSLGAGIGLTTDKVDEIVTHCDAIITAIQEVEKQKIMQKAAVIHKKSTLISKGPALRVLIKQIKNADGYTKAKGIELDVIGGSKKADDQEFMPKINPLVVHAGVQIKFKKKGVEGINIYASKQGETDFQLISRATRSPFLHKLVLQNPGQPEKWLYKAYGVVADVEIGKASNITEVVFG